MNRWYLAGQMLRQKDAWIPVLGFAVCFVWLLSSCRAYFGLYLILREPAVIYGESAFFSGELRQYITELEGVEAVTRVTKTTAGIQWEDSAGSDYTGSMPVYGVEAEYMEWLARENLSADGPFSEGMAYGILSESAMGNLEKKKQTQTIQGFGDLAEKSEKRLVLTEDDLMKDFTLEESDTVRLYGLIESEDEMEGLYLSEKWYAEFFPDAAVSDSGAVSASSTSQSVLMNVSHGYQVEKIIGRLAVNNVSARSSVTDKSAAVQEECMTRLYTGIIILICSICLLVYQEKLWKERHRNVIIDLERFFGSRRAVRGISTRRRVLLIVAGIAGSFVWQWISTVFEW